MHFRTLLFVFGLWNVGDMASAGAADRIAFGVSRPPYVMQDRATGISVELFKSVYGRLGRDFVPKYVSNARMEHSLSAGDVDVAVEVKKTDPKIFYSEKFVSYRNYIITRADVRTSIVNYVDLRGMSVCTWQNADEHLGPDFWRAMSLFTYQEFANQDAQVRVFLSGRCDAVIIDEQIFKYWAAAFNQDRTFKRHIKSMAFAYNPVPGQAENEFYVGFRSRDLRDQFDRELAALKASGAYDRIVQWKDWSKPPS